MSQQDDILTALNAILEALQRIEERQIRTTKMVEEVEKAEEQHTTGSFGTTEEPK